MVDCGEDEEVDFETVAGFVRLERFFNLLSIAGLVQGLPDFGWVYHQGVLILLRTLVTHIYRTLDIQSSLVECRGYGIH